MSGREVLSSKTAPELKQTQYYRDLYRTRISRIRYTRNYLKGKLKPGITPGRFLKEAASLLGMQNPPNNAFLLVIYIQAKLGMRKIPKGERLKKEGYIRLIDAKFGEYTFGELMRNAKTRSLKKYVKSASLAQVTLPVRQEGGSAPPTSGPGPSNVLASYAPRSNNPRTIDNVSSDLSNLSNVEVTPALFYKHVNIHSFVIPNSIPGTNHMFASMIYPKNPRGPVKFCYYFSGSGMYRAILKKFRESRGRELPDQETLNRAFNEDAFSKKKLIAAWFLKRCQQENICFVLLSQMRPYNKGRVGGKMDWGGESAALWYNAFRRAGPTRQVFDYVRNEYTQKTGVEAPMHGHLVGHSRGSKAISNIIKLLQQGRLGGYSFSGQYSCSTYRPWPVPYEYYRRGAPLFISFSKRIPVGTEANAMAVVRRFRLKKRKVGRDWVYTNPEFPNVVVVASHTHHSWHPARYLASGWAHAQRFRRGRQLLSSGRNDAPQRPPRARQPARRASLNRSNLDVQTSDENPESFEGLATQHSFFFPNSIPGNNYMFGSLILPKRRLPGRLRMVYHLSGSGHHYDIVQFFKKYRGRKLPPPEVLSRAVRKILFKRSRKMFKFLKERWAAGENVGLAFISHATFFNAGMVNGRMDRTGAKAALWFNAFNQANSANTVIDIVQNIARKKTGVEPSDTIGMVCHSRGGKAGTSLALLQEQGLLRHKAYFIRSDSTYRPWPHPIADLKRGVPLFVSFSRRTPPGTTGTAANARKIIRALDLTGRRVGRDTHYTNPRYPNVLIIGTDTNHSYHPAKFLEIAWRHTQRALRRGRTQT